MTAVSIIMPAFNAAATLPDAIRSVQAQTFSDWELVVVDDASQDATADLCRETAEADSRIRLLRAPRNGGVARARNLGIDATSGTHIAFLDADDIWLPDKLAVQFPKDIDTPPFSCMAYCHVDASGRAGKCLTPPPEVSYRTLERGSQVGLLTVAIDRGWLGARRFPLRGHEDFALWLALMRDGSVARRMGEARPYAHYRVNNGSLSANKLRAARWMYSIWREQERCGPLRAARHTAAHLLRGLAKHYF